MPTVGEELMGRGGNLNTLRRRYRVDVTGSANPEYDVADWVITNAPATLLGLVQQDLTLEENPEIADEYLAELTYSTIDKKDPAPSGEMEYRFNFQATGGHFYQSLQTIHRVAGSGDAPNFHGALNVVEENGKRRVEGLQVDPPAETFTLAYYPINAVVDGTYQALVERLCGKVNSGTFRGKPAGSVMLVRVAGGARTNEDWTIEFGFGYVQNQDTAVPVGPDISIPNKNGLDLLWAYYEDDNDTTAQSLVKRPVAAYVERVWPRDDLSLLNLPA